MYYIGVDYYLTHFTFSPFLFLSVYNAETNPLSPHAVLSLGDFCCFLLHKSSFSRVLSCWCCILGGKSVLGFFCCYCLKGSPWDYSSFKSAPLKCWTLTLPRHVQVWKKHLCETAAAFICVHHNKDEVKAHHLKSHIRLVSFSHCYKDLNSSQCHFC